MRYLLTQSNYHFPLPHWWDQDCTLCFINGWWKGRGRDSEKWFELWINTVKLHQCFTISVLTVGSNFYLDHFVCFPFKLLSGKIAKITKIERCLSGVLCGSTPCFIITWKPRSSPCILFAENLSHESIKINYMEHAHHIILLSDRRFSTKRWRNTTKNYPNIQSLSKNKHAIKCNSYRIDFELNEDP